MRLHELLYPLYSPDGDGSPSSPELAPVSVLDIAEELGGDDEEQVGDEERGKEEEAGDEEEENKGIELVEGEETTEDSIPELVNPLSRKALLKEYPDIFKKFPQLEKGYYASQKYREYFPTLDDAKEASDKIEKFTEIERELEQGNPSSLIASAKDKPETFAQLVDNYLPALGKADPDAYYHVIGNVLKTTIVRMGKTAQAKQDDDLLTAAKILHEWAFGESTQVTPPVPYMRGRVTPQQDELEREKEEFHNQKLQDNQEEVKSKVNSVIKGTIEQYIDPNERMTPFAKRAAVKEALDKVNELLEKDRELKRLTEKLWKTAQESKYSSETVGKIRRATQERAKVILPQVIKKVRADALKGVERRPSSNPVDRQGPLPNSGRQSTSQFKSGRTPSKVPGNMNTLDFFNS